ncbi:Cytochrome b/b6/petB [Candidatus Kryptonium thompsonii]|nr:Cytochrome b/b6/petB [Candidatus Kryptonium thompsoni]
MDPKKEAERLIKEVEAEEGVTLDAEFREKLKNEIAEKIRSEIERKRKEIKRKVEEEEEYFVRFSLNVRLQHLTLAVGVILLIITGLPIKFHESKIAELFFDLIGGIQVSRILHRIGAGLLIFVSIWHTLYIAFTKEGRNEFKELLPRKKDFLDFWQNIKYMLGKTNERPKYGRYSYIEKFDYWAVYWGMVIMVFFGFDFVVS